MSERARGEQEQSQQAATTTTTRRANETERNTQRTQAGTSCSTIELGCVQRGSEELSSSAVSPRSPTVWAPERLLANPANTALRLAFNVFLSVMNRNNARYQRLTAERRASDALKALADIDSRLRDTAIGLTLTKPQWLAAREAMHRHAYALATPLWRTPELDAQDRKFYQRLGTLEPFITPEFLGITPEFESSPFFTDARRRLPQSALLHAHNTTQQHRAHIKQDLSTWTTTRARRRSCLWCLTC